MNYRISHNAKHVDINPELWEHSLQRKFWKIYFCTKRRLLLPDINKRVVCKKIFITPVLITLELYSIYELSDSPHFNVLHQKQFIIRGHNMPCVTILTLLRDKERFWHGDCSNQLAHWSFDTDLTTLSSSNSNGKAHWLCWVIEIHTNCSRKSNIYW